MLSKEERKQSAKDRAEKRKLLYEQLPGAWLQDRDVAISLAKGEVDQIDVRKLSDWNRDFSNTEETVIFIRNPIELLRLIHALIARYNSLVDSLNETADKCQIKTVKKVVGPKGEGSGGAARTRTESE